MVALAGATVAVSWVVAFTATEAEVGVMLTPVTATPPEPVVTVMVLVAVLFPSWVVTVTVAEPAATPVTKPLALTVATPGFELDQVTFWLVALLGATVAVSCVVAFTATVTVVGLTLTPVTATVAPPATAKAAPFNVTLPAPALIVQVTVKLCPALAALYVKT